jgi:ABC-type branched-subunit amino acid transport system ATPase component
MGSRATRIARFQRAGRSLPVERYLSPMVNKDSLRCDKLHKSFNGIRVLADVCLEFPDSGIIAIIGPNGAGKTTLLNILTGFLRPDSGHCFFRGQDITHAPPHRIAKLGIVRTFQDLRLIHQISALENVLLARPRQRGENLLDALLRFQVAKQENQNRQD